ncbi:MAG TPA: glucose-6-phosphate dehydrogenase assembly protein OpcA [Solirubrobacteraceae bacterium]|jgi:glucose-6-phosphate dehydrogenase assembly protein OpcA
MSAVAQSLPDAVWSAQGTTPDAIEAALRELVKQRHGENGGLAPARALNMIVFVESRYSGEIANRLAGVGRYHASRLVVLSYDPSRTRLDARAVVSTDNDPAEGELGLLRETVTVEIGERHLDDLVTIVDPLVVTDLTTLLWSPHGHPDAVDALLELSQTVLVDSLDEPSWREAIGRACELRGRAYVVDLAWLRSTPWRERVAAAFDSPTMRAELGGIETVAVRHHPDSTVAAMLLVGWLGSRLGWEMGRLSPNEGVLTGTANGNITIRLEQAPEQEVRGLESVAIATADGRRLGLKRGPGGLRARARDGDGREREWTILGASRGESGILGEGIRQSLLRDPTYGPALAAAEAMNPDQRNEPLQ